MWLGLLHCWRLFFVEIKMKTRYPRQEDRFYLQLRSSANMMLSINKKGARLLRQRYQKKKVGSFQKYSLSTMPLQTKRGSRLRNKSNSTCSSTRLVICRLFIRSTAGLVFPPRSRSPNCLFKKKGRAP